MCLNENEVKNNIIRNFVRSNCPSESEWLELAKSIHSRGVDIQNQEVDNLKVIKEEIDNIFERMLSVMTQ